MRIRCVFRKCTQRLPAISRSIRNNCWFHHLIELTERGVVRWKLLELPGGMVGCCAVGWRLRAAQSPAHPGPSESGLARRARAVGPLPAPAVLIARCARISGTTSRYGRERPGSSMLARSLVLCLWAPLGAAHPHDNHRLASSAFGSELAPDPPSDKQLTRAPRSRK